MSTALKRKRISKKNKSAWRKYINVEDVDDFLEEQREAERIGDFSTKKDGELFTIDLKGSKSLLSSKELRKLHAQKPAKNLSALENTSAVQDPITKRNKVKPKKHGRNLLEEVTNPTSQKHKQANEDRGKYYVALAGKIEGTRQRNFNEDIWGNHNGNLKEYGNQEWVSKDLALHHLKNTGRAHIKIPKTIRKKTTPLKPVEKPDPGASYNPSLKDHQNLLSKVLSKEEKIMKEERHLRRVTTDMFSKVLPEERDNEKMKEMACGIESENTEITQNTDSIQECDINTYSPINPPVVVKKKGKQTRRKQKEQKEIQRNIKEKKLQQKKISDINKLKELNKEILEDEKAKNTAKKNKKIKLRQKRLEPNRLGKLKFQELDVDFNEAKDIAGNLRNIKTENSLLVDRFKVMQKRNVLPVSVDVGVRKRRKIKRFVRNTHKEILARPTKAQSRKDKHTKICAV